MLIIKNFLPMEKPGSSRGKPRILFVLHLPPPVHGAGLMGEQVRACVERTDAFGSRFINLSASSTVESVGRIGLNKLLFMRRLLGEVCRTVREWHPDLVYMTPSATMPGLLKDALVARLVRRKGCKLVLHFHNKGVVSRQDHLLDDGLYRMLFRDASVILLSRLLYPDVRKYVPEERVEYCPNGVSVPTLVLPSPPAAVPRILFLSNMIRSKGVSVLVDACKALHERGIPFRCSLVGALSADYPGDSLVAEIREKGLEDCVAYEGPRYGDEKWKAFAEADVFAFPTFYPEECFPLVVLEAMGSGLPVVTTTEGALPEMVREGVDGFICPKKDPVALADALERLLSDPDLRARMGECSRARYDALFTREQFEKKMIDILNRHVHA